MTPRALSRRMNAAGMMAAALMVAAFSAPSTARAGMPSPYGVLTELGKARFSAMSFFLFGIIVSALGVKWLWNGLAKDFPGLPRLTFRGSLGMVLVWGLAVILVLTMISGARELMTPGAWKTSGITYALNEPEPSPASEAEPKSERVRKLEKLRFALWQHAAANNGRFPESTQTLPAELWESPDVSRMAYAYHGGLTATSSAILAMEPDIFGGARLALLTSGDIVSLETQSSGSAPLIPPPRVPAEAELPPEGDVP
jgi:hypothetical protein